MEMHCVVTGASRGLGLEIVQQLLATGWQVTATSRSASEPLSGLLAAHPQQLSYFPCDLARPSEQVLQDWREGLPNDIVIDGFVNNAALAYDDLVTNANTAQLEQMMHVNVTVPVMLTKFVLRRMLLHSTRGSLVHLSSVSVQRGFRGLAMYAATKAAMEGFSKGVAREWGRMGIRSNCVVPGFMETDMSAELDERQREQVFRRTALGEATSVASVARTIRFLLSDEASSVTGTNIAVDAGA